MYSRNLIYKEIYLNYNKLKKNSIKIRIYYFDLLRIFSAFSVILIHVSAEYYNHINIDNPNWKISFYYNGFSRFGVPIFFMISGTLFLGKNISLYIIIYKYILRLVICLIIWSFIYSIYNIEFSKNNIEKILLKFFSGHFHFWYIFATIELYILSPFLREIVKSNLLNDLIKISFIFTFLITNLNILNEIINLSHLKNDITNIKGCV